MWLLKSPFDQNSIMINHKLNGNFNSHIILGGKDEFKGDRQWPCSPPPPPPPPPQITRNKKNLRQKKIGLYSLFKLKAISVPVLRDSKGIQERLLELMPPKTKRTPNISLFFH
jgi:hypothetical protein